MGINFQRGNFKIAPPTQPFLNYMDNDLGYHGTYLCQNHEVHTSFLEKSSFSRRFGGYKTQITKLIQAILFITLSCEMVSQRQ